MQLKRDEISSDYHFNLSSKWSIPEDMTNEEAEEYRYEQIRRMRKDLEPIAQAEVDDLLEQKSNLE